MNILFIGCIILLVLELLNIRRISHQNQKTLVELANSLVEYSYRQFQDSSKKAEYAPRRIRALCFSIENNLELPELKHFDEEDKDILRDKYLELRSNTRIININIHYLIVSVTCLLAILAFAL